MSLLNGTSLRGIVKWCKMFFWDFPVVAVVLPWVALTRLVPDLHGVLPKEVSLLDVPNLASVEATHDVNVLLEDELCRAWTPTHQGIER